MPIRDTLGIVESSVEGIQEIWCHEKRKEFQETLRCILKRVTVTSNTTFYETTSCDTGGIVPRTVNAYEVTISLTNNTGHDLGDVWITPVARGVVPYEHRDYGLVPWEEKGIKVPIPVLKAGGSYPRRREELPPNTPPDEPIKFCYRIGCSHLLPIDGRPHIEILLSADVRPFVTADVKVIYSAG